MADKESCPRVLINIEHVGDFGKRKNDVVLLGKCDDIIRELCKALGWEEKLEQLWAETASVVEEAEKAEAEGEKQDEALKKEVDLLTAAVEAQLALQDKNEEGKSIAKETVAVDEPRGSILTIPPESLRETAESADSKDSARPDSQSGKTGADKETSETLIIPTTSDRAGGKSKDDGNTSVEGKL
jgi:NAD+-dependent protein deacetylase SIR2